MAKDQTAETPAPLPELPAFSFYTISTEEFRSNLEKRDETPWPVVFNDGRWVGDRNGAKEFAVYKPEWNGGLPFVVIGLTLPEGLTIKAIADAEGVIQGTEIENPKAEVSDEVQDGGGLRGVQAATEGDAGGTEEAEKEAPEATGASAT